MISYFFCSSFLNNLYNLQMDMVILKINRKSRDKDMYFFENDKHSLMNLNEWKCHNKNITDSRH